MSGAIMNKVWGFIRNGSSKKKRKKITIENDYEYEDEEEEEENRRINKLFGRRNNKVVAMPQAQASKNGYITTNNI